MSLGLRHLALVCLLGAGSASALQRPPAGRTPLPIGDKPARAATLRSEGRLDDAAALLEGYVRLCGDDVDARLLLVDVRLDGGDYLRALLAAEPISLVRRDLAVLERLAIIYGKLGRYRDYASVLDAICQQTGDTADRLLELASAHLAAGDPSESAAALDRYLVQAPDDVDRWEQVATLRDGLGHPVDSVRAWKRVTELRTSDFKAFERLGDAYTRRKMDDEAAAAFARAVELSPDDSVLMWKSIEASSAIGDTVRAEALLGRLAARPSSEGDARDRLALLQASRGESAAAVATLAPAAAREPNNLKRRLSLARYASDDGDVDVAIAELEAFLGTAPTNMDAQRLLADTYPSRSQHREALRLYDGLIGATSPNDELELQRDLAAGEVGPRITPAYEYLQDSTGLTRHHLTLGADHQALDWLRWGANYGWSHYEGRPRIDLAPDASFNAHRGGVGVDLKSSPRSVFEINAGVSAYDNDIPTFADIRLGWRYAHGSTVAPWNLRLWLARSPDESTLDAILFDTARYDVGAGWDVEVSRFLLELEVKYGRFIHTDPLTTDRIRNNGVEWLVTPGVRLIDDPLSLDLLLEYGGTWFQTSSDEAGGRIPYFAPDLYQTVALPLVLYHDVNWQFRYSLTVRPLWVFEDEAFQLAYGAELRVRFHPQHSMNAGYQRTDTLVGDATRIFQENLFTISYTGAF